VNGQEVLLRVGENAVIGKEGKKGKVRADISLGVGSCVDGQLPVVTIMVGAGVGAGLKPALTTGSKIAISVSAMDECKIDAKSLVLRVKKTPGEPFERGDILLEMVLVDVVPVNGKDSYLIKKGSSESFVKAALSQGLQFEIPGDYFIEASVLDATGKRGSQEISLTVEISEDVGATGGLPLPPVTEAKLFGVFPSALEVMELDTALEVVTDGYLEDLQIKVMDGEAEVALEDLEIRFVTNLSLPLKGRLGGDGVHLPKDNS
jgi:hypothetical protein